MPAREPFSFRWMVLVPVVLLVGACSGGDNANTDTAGGTPAATATTDTSMAGMDHSGMAMNRSAPRDSNQSFLRMMSDHHQGLILMSDTAMAKQLGATAKADAQKLRQKQKSEQDHMLHLLSTQYSDSITPMVMPSNQQMIQAVASASGGDADRVYYQQVIAHHREGIQMAEKMLPQLTGEQKQMAQKSISDQRKEIAEFERKAGGGAR